MSKSALEVLEAIVESADFAQRVRALRDEAGVAGDTEQVWACNRALEAISTGNPSCLDCAEVLRRAQALEQSEVVSGHPYDPRCDCDSCYAGNLQRIGANG